MKISYDWIKEFVDIKKTPQELANDLSLFGQEVDSVEKNGNDFVLDLEITPNRGDCLSILGIAREISALYNVPLKKEILEMPQIKTEDIGKSINVRISDSKICPRFTARIIDNIKIGESPEWMREKLAAYGFRPINNIVDITNYVMVATGQPLHAFDYDKIASSEQGAVGGKLMNIRLSKKGEEVMTLDGKNRILKEDTIIIEDTEKIYDLAAIMGGYKSEVDDNTKTIVLVGSIFDPILVRAASKYLNHVTDSSYRYERGVDFEGTEFGVNTATKLILELSPGAKAGELIDSWTPECAKIFGDEPVGQKKWQCKSIEVDPQKVNKLLGTDLSIDEMENYLKRLNMEVETKEEKMIVTPPSYRFYDVAIWEDVAEEIARMIGYNQLGKTQISKAKSQNINQEFKNKEIIKDQLKDLGFTEISSYSFIDKKKLELLGGNTDEIPQIEKPLSPETEYLRPDLQDSLLTAISRNPWAPEIKIFEIGKVFSARRGSAFSGEEWQIGIATVGKSNQLISEAKSLLKIDADIQTIDQNILDSYKIRRPVQIVISDLRLAIREGMYSEEISNKKYKKISTFPPTVRDMAFIVDSKINADEVAEEINKISEKVLLVELFDEFTSDKFGKDKKNLAYHIWIQDLEKPMDEKEVQEIIKNISDMMSQKYQAKLRA